MTRRPPFHHLLDEEKAADDETAADDEKAAYYEKGQQLGQLS